MKSSLSDRITEAMTEAGVSPGELADACGVRVQSVYQWRSGVTKKLEGTNLAKASRKLGVIDLWLGEGKGPKKAEAPAGAFSDGTSERLKSLIKTLRDLEESGALTPAIIDGLQAMVDGLKSRRK